MKETAHFLSIPEIFHYFPNNNETDLNVYMIGYHNFHYIKAERFVRQQPCYTLHYIISGKGFLQVNGKKISVYPNQVFYLDNKASFCYYPDDSDPWEYVFFELSGNYVGNYAEMLNLSADDPVRTCNNQQTILFLIKEALRENTIPSSFIAKSLLFMLMDSISRQEQNVHYSQGERIIKEAKELIELKFSDASLDLEFICKAIHVSHSHFCKIFKKSQGITPIQFVNKVRMDHAKELLTKSNLSVYEIAFKVGYREYEHFLRLFKTLNEMTPSQYRKKFS